MKHKATWLACAVTITCEMWVLTHKLDSCKALLPCGSTKASNGTGVLTSPQAQSAFHSGDSIPFNSNHSLTLERMDCPNNCLAKATVELSNGYIAPGGGETTVATGNCTLSWGAGSCGAQTCTSTISGTASIINLGDPVRYSGFVKTVGPHFALDDASVQFLIVPPGF